LDDAAEPAAGFGQRVVDPDGRARRNAALDEALRLQLLQARRQHAIAHGVKPRLELAEAQAALAIQRRHDEAVPGLGEHGHRRLEHRAEMLARCVLHGAAALAIKPQHYAAVPAH